MSVNVIDGAAYYKCTPLLNHSNCLTGLLPCKPRLKKIIQELLTIFFPVIILTICLHDAQ